jgi:hypothetical protein
MMRELLGVGDEFFSTKRNTALKLSQLKFLLRF